MPPKCIGMKRTIWDTWPIYNSHRSLLCSQVIVHIYIYTSLGKGLTLTSLRSIHHPPHGSGGSFNRCHCQGLSLCNNQVLGSAINVCASSLQWQHALSLAVEGNADVVTLTEVMMRCLISLELPIFSEYFFVFLLDVWWFHWSHFL